MKIFLIIKDGKCNHCQIKLTCEQGTVIDVNYTRASLDRIDTNIAGYGNGNAQWLCVSCNKGKCTMSDELHRAKFNILEKKDKEIEELKKYCEELKERYEDKYNKLVESISQIQLEVKQIKRVEIPKIKPKIEKTEKQCSKCSEILPIENFNKKSDTADGYQPYCKLCVNEAKKVSKYKEKAKDNEYSCEQCTKVYKLKDSLTRHTREKH